MTTCASTHDAVQSSPCTHGYTWWCPWVHDDAESVPQRAPKGPPPDETGPGIKALPLPRRERRHYR